MMGKGEVERGEKGDWGLGIGDGGAYLFEKAVVDLFYGADFDCFHHFAGGDDDAAEDFGGGGHCALMRGVGLIA